MVNLKVTEMKNASLGVIVEKHLFTKTDYQLTEISEYTCRIQ